MFCRIWHHKYMAGGASRCEMYKARRQFVENSSNQMCKNLSRGINSHRFSDATNTNTNVLAAFLF
jgi:hypothetical protein